MSSPVELYHSNGPPRLRRNPPFVGRHEHLHQLEYWLQESIAGRPRVVLIEGGAGIGKTRLIKELWPIAQHHGVQICTGRGYEDLTLPYLPFVDMLRSPMELSLEDPTCPLGSDAEIINQFLNLVESASPTDQTTSSAQAAHDKLRLFVAVSRTTIKLAQKSPILMVLDDLQWADRSSLDLLGHLVFSIVDTNIREPIPLLILGTHRPVVPDELLARLIARLQREDICQHLTLNGLSESEVHVLTQGIGLERPSHQLITTINEATQGNPLFIQEVIYYLLKQNALQERGGYVTTNSSPFDLPLPGQITSAIISRLQEMSEECRKVHTVASFLGDNFSLQELGAVSGLNEEELLNLIDEGISQQVLVCEGQEFQFTHALYRSVCYNETSAARRPRIHMQIAKALEHLYADNLDAHIQKIAHHLIRAGTVAEVEKTVQYARKAGDQAFAIFAWGDAARYYSAALSIAETTDYLTDHEQASLHYEAGLAYFRDMDAGPCLDHYEKAVDAYRKVNNIHGLAKALIERTRCQFSIASVPYGVLVDVEPLEQVLRELEEKDAQLKGTILGIMSGVYWHARQPDKAKEMAQNALTIGLRLQDDHLCAYARFQLGLAELQGLYVKEALESWQKSFSDARRAGAIWVQNWPLTRMPLNILRLGRLDEAERVALEGCASTRKIHDWASYSMALAGLVTVSVARGEFAASERYTHEVLLMVSRSRYPFGGLFSLQALAGARAMRGAWAEAEDALDILLTPGRVFKEAGPVLQANAKLYRQLVRAYAEEPEVVDARIVSDLLSTRTIDPYMLAPICALVEIDDFMTSSSIDPRAYEILALAAERRVCFTSGGWNFLLPRILGIAATLNQWWDKAEMHFKTAIELASDTGARPELGRSYLDYARMLAFRKSMDNRHGAVELLGKAFPIFYDLGMEPFIRRAVKLAEVLHMPTPSAPQQSVNYPDNLSAQEIGVLLHMANGRTNTEIADRFTLSTETITHHRNNVSNKTGATGWKEAALYALEKGLVSQIFPRRRLDIPSKPDGRGGEEKVDPRSLQPKYRSLCVVLVTDMEGSAVALQRLGDEKASELHHTHNRITRACLREYRGSEVTHTGDGIEASFASASTAIECAIAMQRAFNSHNQAHPDTPIRLRSGLTAGEPIPMGDRLFGTAVYTAFRICEISQPGQILVSDVVQQLASGKDFSFIDRGSFELKGFSGDFQLYEVPWETE